MDLRDNVEMKGHFLVKAFKKDGSVEIYEDKNLIMDSARSNMAELVGGWTAGVPIDKFVLGNKGHNGSDILDYKKVGENNEFLSSNTTLFAEDSDNDDPDGDGEEDGSNGKANFTYGINFNVQSKDAVKVDEETTAEVKGERVKETKKCTVKRAIADRTCTFTITIPDECGNRAGEGEVVAYTEAALYAGEDIFSMKTFPARVKEDTVKFEITWAIIF